MKDHYTPTVMAKTKKTDSTKCSSKVNLLQDPKIPFLSIYPREMKIYVHRRGLYKKLELLHSHSSSSKKKCPSTGEWINCGTSIPKNSSEQQKRTNL